MNALKAMGESPNKDKQDQTETGNQNAIRKIQSKKHGKQPKGFRTFAMLGIILLVSFVCIARAGPERGIWPYHKPIYQVRWK
jgi:hypothetical protein